MPNMDRFEFLRWLMASRRDAGRQLRDRPG
jgi:hypothetical protein